MTPVVAALARDRRVGAGAVLLLLLAMVAVLAPWIAPYDPLAQPDILRLRYLAPFSSGPDGTFHLLGTDQLGRDLLSRLLYGARISLTIGVAAALLSAALGTLIGAAAATGGRQIERSLMGLTDVALALPRLILLLLLVALWKPSHVLVVVVLAMTGWMGIARLVRAEVKGLLARPFAEAARAAGSTTPRLVRQHLLPNALTPVIVATSLGVGNAIALEAGLSFLGLGVPAPAPSWGNMMSAGRDALVQAPWIATVPGLAVVLAVIACNLLGDGLRDALDPATAHGSTTIVTASRGSASKRT